MSLEKKSFVGRVKGYSLITSVSEDYQGVEYVNFYIVDKAEEEKFVSNPAKLDTSNNAKVIYCISNNDYDSDPEKHENKALEIFDKLTPQVKEMSR